MKTPHSVNKLIGYSERGMMNALCMDLVEAPPQFVLEFVKLISFPFGKFVGPRLRLQSCTLLVEQSFSCFGEADLTILLDFENGKRKCIFVEAKVDGDRKRGRDTQKRWQFFKNFIEGKKRGSSALFSQMYRKNQLVRYLAHQEVLEVDCVSKRWSLGRNRVVNRAVEMVKPYLNDTWVVALLPETEQMMDEFFNSTLKEYDPNPKHLPGWDVSRWGYLSWRRVEKYVNENKDQFRNTLAALEWNRELVYCNWETE